MDSFFQENILNIKDGDNFCSHKFYYKTDSFVLYNYWSLYLTNKYKKKVHFAYSKNIPKDCKWYIDIIFHKYSTEMIVKDLNTLKEFRYFESQTSIFKNF